MKVYVSIGIIFNMSGQVLLSLRNKTILADYWEFPGGKREENEDLEDAFFKFYDRREKIIFC